MHNKRLFLTFILLFNLLLLFGCGGSTSRSDLEEFIKQTKALHKHAVEPLPPTVAKVNSKYLGVAKRSPFMTSDEFIKSQVVSSSAIDAPDETRTKEPLEKFTFEELVLVGSIKKEDITWGLISDNTGRVYKVKEGNYIGPNYGKIMKINEKNIEIKEAVSNGFGGWQSNEVIMKLKE